jgi:hypothetical protein
MNLKKTRKYKKSKSRYNKRKRTSRSKRLGGCGCKKQLPVDIKGGCGCNKTHMIGGNNISYSTYESTGGVSSNPVSSIVAYPLNTNDSLPFINSRNLENGVYSGGKRRNRRQSVKKMKGGGFLNNVSDFILGNNNNPILNANTSMGAVYAANVVSGNNLPATFGQYNVNNSGSSFFGPNNSPIV